LSSTFIFKKANFSLDKPGQACYNWVCPRQKNGGADFSRSVRGCQEKNYFILGLTGRDFSARLESQAKKPMI
jgi:hypothetical protein